MFRRRLKEGASFDDFIAAWEADQGFGVPARVFNALSLTDDREILSVGFLDIDAAALADLAAGVSEQEAVRHARIDEVIESTELRAFYHLRTEHDFSFDPRQIDPNSAESLLANLLSRASGT
ncbi:MAG: hypothetical protein V9E98_05920 [Candidatus Nanopelagicales bacterium]